VFEQHLWVPAKKLTATVGNGRDAVQREVHAFDLSTGSVMLAIAEPEGTEPIKLAKGEYEFVSLALYQRQCVAAAISLLRYRRASLGMLLRCEELKDFHLQLITFGNGTRVPNSRPAIPNAPFTVESALAAVANGRASQADVSKALALAELAGQRAVQSAGTPVVVEPPVQFQSFSEWCTRISFKEKRAWCNMIAKRANRKRLLSPAPNVKLTGRDVWGVLERARGRCEYCGSLALERRPSQPNGAPLRWDYMGRRIGSLSHLVPRFHGGDNDVANLAWACLWCNTYESERIWGATNCGGHHVDEVFEVASCQNPFPFKAY
jgi:hypothetical protein